MKDLSIVIVGYNAEKTIERAIESCLEQTHENIDIIMIDDGSKDNTSKICKEYSLKYPEKFFYYYKENGGVASARNEGLKKIDGTYFTFLDSDDYLEEDMAEKMLAAAKENDADIVFSNFFYTYKDHEIVYKEDYYSDSKGMVQCLNATLWNKLFKTEFIKKTGVAFSDVTRYEDTSFLYKIAPYVKNVNSVDRAFLHYVQDDSSTVHSYDLRVLQVIEVWDDIIDFYKKNGFYEEYQKELEYSMIRYMQGQPYRYCCKIENKKDRSTALNALWKELNSKFPKWRNNFYLKHMGGKKNLYFRFTTKFTYFVMSNVFKRI